MAKARFTTRERICASASNMIYDHQIQIGASYLNYLINDVVYTRSKAKSITSGNHILHLLTCADNVSFTCDLLLEPRVMHIHLPLEDGRHCELLRAQAGRNNKRP